MNAVETKKASLMNGEIRNLLVGVYTSDKMPAVKGYPGA